MKIPALDSAEMTRLVVWVAAGCVAVNSVLLVSTYLLPNEPLMSDLPWLTALFLPISWFALWKAIIVWRSSRGSDGKRRVLKQISFGNGRSAAEPRWAGVVCFWLFGAGWAAGLLSLIQLGSQSSPPAGHHGLVLQARVLISVPLAFFAWAINSLLATERPFASRR